MDLRIVNTCNNNCLYCLEQGLRKKKKFIDKNEIFNILEEEKNKEILCFYGGNSILHPDLQEIISFAKNNGFKNISLLTNTFGLDEKILKNFKKSGLNGISFYFNSFSEDKQNLLTNSGISVKNLIKNIILIQKNNFNLKCIIHINKQNIENIFENIFILNKKFNIFEFEFIKYHLVSRAKNFENILKIEKKQEKIFLDKMKNFSKKLNINIEFKKF